MNIYVSNLNFSVTDAQLNDLFASYGEVTSANIVKFRDTGRSRGFGFVEMSDDAAAQKAIDELNQSSFEDKNISVEVARPKTDRPEGGFNRGGDRGGYGDRSNSNFRKRY